MKQAREMSADQNVLSKKLLWGENMFGVFCVLTKDAKFYNRIMSRVCKVISSGFL